MNNLASSYHALGRHAEALKFCEETLALHKAKLGPDHRYTLLSMHNLANSYGALGRHAEALKLREETLELRKARQGPDHPDTLITMHALALSYRALGRWDEALAASGRAIALGTDHHDTWNHAAIFWARTGDRAGYRGHCRRMLDRFGPTTDPIIAERSAWAEATRGLAAYRREQFADAVAWADRCLARAPGDWNRELPCHLVRAMALSRLGRVDEAGAARARASDLYRTKVASPGGPAAGRDWPNRVICEVLRREAEALFLDRDFPADPFAR
jgi:tetratricopeptide (TPR) repeat protein